MAISLETEWWDADDDGEEVLSPIHLHESTTSTTYNNLINDIVESDEKVLIVHHGASVKKRELLERVSDRITPITEVTERGAIPEEAESLLLSFPNADILSSKLQRLDGHATRFDKVICIVDTIISRTIAERVSRPWIEGEADEEGRSAAAMNTSSFTSQPEQGFDKQHVNISQWYPKAITLQYRGNFRPGLYTDKTSFPISIYTSIFALTPCDSWEIHFIESEEKLVPLMEAAIHAMLGM